MRDGGLLLLKVKEKLFSLEKRREDLVTQGITGLMALLVLKWAALYNFLHTSLLCLVSAKNAY